MRSQAVPKHPSPILPHCAPQFHRSDQLACESLVSRWVPLPRTQEPGAACACTCVLDGRNRVANLVRIQISVNLFLRCRWWSWLFGRVSQHRRKLESIGGGSIPSIFNNLNCYYFKVLKVLKVYMHAYENNTFTLEIMIVLPTQFQLVLFVPS